MQWQQCSTHLDPYGTSWLPCKCLVCGRARRTGTHILEHDYCTMVNSNVQQPVKACTLSSYLVKSSGSCPCSGSSSLYCQSWGVINHVEMDINISLVESLSHSDGRTNVVRYTPFLLLSNNWCPYHHWACRLRHPWISEQEAKSKAIRHFFRDDTNFHRFNRLSRFRISFTVRYSRIHVYATSFFAFSCQWWEKPDAEGCSR